MATGPQDAIAQLADGRSPRRRAAAKIIRRLGDPTAGPALIDALVREADNPVTWETQYQIVMALGECRYVEAIGYLENLATLGGRASLCTGIGHALARLHHESDHRDPVGWCLRLGNDAVMEGALRAVATSRVPLAPDVVDEILDVVERRTGYDPLRFWPAVAAVDWPGRRARRFLQACATGPRPDVADAARESLAGRRPTYSYV